MQSEILMGKTFKHTLSMERFRKLSVKMRVAVLIAAGILCGAAAQAATLAEADSIVECLSKRAVESDSYVTLDSAEILAVSFMQAVGDLHLLHGGGFTIHGQSEYVDSGEVANVVKWYRANRRYFSDAMYDEYVTMMVEHPLVGRIDGGNNYYCAAADSPHYIPALTIIRRLNSEFLKAKYGTL